MRRIARTVALTAYLSIVFLLMALSNCAGPAPSTAPVVAAASAVASDAGTAASILDKLATAAEGVAAAVATDHALPIVAAVEAAKANPNKQTIDAAINLVLQEAAGVPVLPTPVKLALEALAALAPAVESLL